MNKIALKICGITDIKSVITAHKNKIKSLGFASNNLHGPNTANDKKIKYLIKECNYYKIESVLLTRFFSLDELIKQIDYTKPKIISCSYHYSTTNLKIIKNINKFKIGKYGLLMGVSRKSWINYIDKSNVNERLGGSLAPVLLSQNRGVDIYRVHDVKETFQAIKVFKRIECSK